MRMAAAQGNQPRNYVKIPRIRQSGRLSACQERLCLWNVFKKTKYRMTWAVQSEFFKNFVATVTVLRLCLRSAAFLRGSLNNCSVPDVCWSRQCVKRTAESATSEKASLNMASQNAAMKDINFSFAWLSSHNHAADTWDAVHTTSHSNVIRLPTEREGFGRKPTRSISKHYCTTSGQSMQSWVGITDDRSWIRIGGLPNSTCVRDMSVTSPLSQLNR